MRLSSSVAGAIGAARLWAGREPRELFAAGFETLARYKLRTALSILGVVLGVAAVIAMLSVSEGAREQALREVELLGLNNVVVRARLGEDDTHRIEAGDAELLRRAVPMIETVSPLVERAAQVRGPRGAVVATVLGVTEPFGPMLGLSPARGRWLGALDVERQTRVCVLGAQVARTLFGFDAAVGDVVAVDGEWLRVVGVLTDRAHSPRGANTLSHRDLNQALLVPLSILTAAAPRADPHAAVGEIWIRVARGERVSEISRVVEHTLAQLPGGRAAEVVVPRELLNQRQRVQRTFGIVVGSVAAITLLVGGIGIMNIMLASVLERTHEIGVRRTVGATRRDITVQFLVESVLMTVSGGLVGIAAGAGVAWGITAWAGWSTRVSPSAVILAAVVSVAVGLGFGIYPARRAAHLNPIDALRYE